METLANAQKADDASGALFSAAQSGQVDRVTALLAAADTREIPVQEEMHDALQIAIRNDFPAVVRVLCAAGAHFGLAVQKYTIMFVYPRQSGNAVEERRNFQPIHLAASAGSASCISELVSNLQVPTGARDSSKDTPLHWACRFAHVDAIRKLLAVKARVGDQNDIADTPLVVAAVYRHIRCVKALVASRLEEPVLRRAISRERYCTDHCRTIPGLLARALQLHTQSATAVE